MQPTEHRLRNDVATDIALDSLAAAHRARVDQSTGVLGTLLSLFQSRSRLQVEILVLRHQLIVLRRTAPKRVRLKAVDRLLLIGYGMASWIRSPSSSRTLSCAGTEVASELYGAGSPDAVWADPA
jgi:hypothetical protein